MAKIVLNGEEYEVEDVERDITWEGSDMIVTTKCGKRFRCVNAYPSGIGGGNSSVDRVEFNVVLTTAARLK